MAEENLDSNGDEIAEKNEMQSYFTSKKNEYGKINYSECLICLTGIKDPKPCRLKKHLKSNKHIKVFHLIIHIPSETLRKIKDLRSRNRIKSNEKYIKRGHGSKYIYE